VEGNETFFVNVTNVSGASIADGQGLGTIVNDDAGPALSINDVSLNEGNSGTTTFTFTVSLSVPAGPGGVTFDIATQDGTATTADGDYTAKSLTAQTIAQGLSSYTFDVLVNGDTKVEGNETFNVNVTNVNGASVLDGQGVGTIVNDDVDTPAPTTVKISQVYGGGGNSGATYKNDFIELFNQSTLAVDVSGWSVQQTSAGGPVAPATTWNVTPLCPSGTCTIQPGHYFLVQEGPGAGGTTNLPAFDVSGTLPLGAGSGKVALVNTTTPLSGGCPSSVTIADLVGYDSSATCSETTPAPTPGNTTGVLRKGNGCTDTNNNANDFVELGPLPRNSSAPPQTCGVPGQLSGLGTATPSSVDPGGNTLLKVQVTPGTNSTGIAVTADLSGLGGSATQQFFDDGTNGDAAAGDNTFSYRIDLPVLPTGAKYITTTVTDQQGGHVTVPITITVQSPTCGVERWAIKVGDDADAALVNTASPVRTTIQAMRALPTPATLPLDHRLQPTETNVFVINGLLTLYKLETDVDYHIVLQDPAGNTMVTEIPSPGCDATQGPTPFDAAITTARKKFDAKLTGIPTFQTANLPVQIKGVGFFDFIHGQTGVAPNGVELHPILDITFTAQSTTTLNSDFNPATYGQNINLTATVTIPAGTPTGNVSFFDGATPLGTALLDGTGHASIPANGLTAGTHTLSASYEGDSAASESAGTLSLLVNQATPVLSWTKPAAVNYGSALSNVQLNATANVPGSFVYTPPGGTVLPVGNGQTLSAVFTPTSANYANGPVSTTIDVLPIQQPSGPSINTTRVLSRDGSNNVVVQLTLTNIGGTTANNVVLTSMKVGAVSAPGLPVPVGTIAPNSSAVVTVNMANPIGASGAASSMTAGGAFTGGTFGSSARITLP
jgi:hypothetical protein